VIGTARAAALIAAAAAPFDRWSSVDLAPLLERIAGARVVLLGEATHGTAEFYSLRARITLELIRRRGFKIVAVEADWPDARQVDRFVRGEPASRHPERAFTRFPTWMWANRQVLRFARELRDWNSARPRAEQAGFYGLDLYSLYGSIRAVLAYLDTVDADVAALARKRYACLAPWEHDPSAYGAAAVSGRFEGCADQVATMLAELHERRSAFETSDGERFFDAERNAALVRNAESYYRALYRGSQVSWNLRDGHMFETLQALLAREQSSRAVVWAHNSHLGNAAATQMSEDGETNLGELCREAFGDGCYAVGLGTSRGTVAAADAWDAPMRVMSVRPARPGSYEGLCHDAGVRCFMLPLRGARADLVEALRPQRLERAIGVIYRPATELASHYFRASLPSQFDEWIWLDETRAVDALRVPDEHHGSLETFPYGL
jgi:protein-L-isoaspartate(D-aspartate) O-methyltransferase